jgi:serine O-acetyltransferase
VPTKHPTLLDKVAVKLLDPKLRVRALLVKRQRAIASGSKPRMRWCAYRLARWGVYINDSAVLEGVPNLPHPTGVVIGKDVVIEEDVLIFQHVTLGSQSGRGSGYPTVRRGAVLLAGASVVGPVEIGAGATVGAHAFVTIDVPPGATAVGVPARLLPARNDHTAGQ